MDQVQKNAKIIATIGPKSRSKEMIWKLHQAGANIFRMNFSHGSHDDHKKVIEWVRELNKENGSNICLLQDLQGPKIRTNQMKNDGVQINSGDKIQIEAGDFEGDEKKISTTYKTIAKDVKAGDCILIDDGNLELKVDNSDGTTVTCTIVFGGMLKSRKGINLPNTKISEPSLTSKDKEDLMFGIEQDVDWVALSFVRTAQDIIELKDIIKSKGKHIKVVAKVEKPEAVANMDEIIAATDAFMVARGDLGVEIEASQVPLLQKEMIAKCNAAGKPVIVATQMLESMIKNPRPTRAETNDVANAILDGADVVMLSGESAAGDFPFEAVSSMAKIIKEVEEKGKNVYFKNYDAGSEMNEMLISAACKLAEQSGAKVIVGMTESGATAHNIAKHRPKAEIFLFTNNQSLVTRLNLIWGVTAYYYDKNTNTDDTIAEVKKLLLSKGKIKSGDVIVNTLGLPSWQGEKTNMIKVSVVD
jgi:pyruvate kinase